MSANVVHISNVKREFQIPKIEIIEYPYKIIRVEPSNRLQPTRSYEDIINVMYSLYRDFTDRIKVDYSGVTYTKQQPVCFEVLYRGKDISFNFAIPENVSEYVKNRIYALMPNSTIIYTDDYLDEFDSSTSYTYTYEKDSMCSLNTNQRDAPLINSLLAITRDIHDDEKVLLQIQMMPLSKNWKEKMDKKWIRLRKGEDVTRKDATIFKILDRISDYIDKSFELVDYAMNSVKTKDIDDNTVKKKELLRDTAGSRQKVNYDGFNVGITNYVKTKDQYNAYAISKSVETAFKEIQGDNILLMGKEKKGVAPLRKNRLISFDRQIMSTKELANIIQLPCGRMQKVFGIKNTRSTQINAPKECYTGYIKLGTHKRNGVVKQLYFPRDRKILCLLKIYLTIMGGGKTTAILNFAHDAILGGDGLMLIDHIDDCKTAMALLELHPETIEIGFRDGLIPPTFAFPEIKILDTDTIEEMQDKASVVATEVKYLLNNMAVDTEDLSRSMSRYLTSACRLVFIHNGMRLKEVMDVLEYKDIRHKFIEMAISKGIYSVTDRVVMNLLELDEDKRGSKIEGIMTRFSVITENSMFERMLDSPASNNVNFVEIMDKQKPMVVTMPQDKFTNKLLKDTMVTYFMCRMRLAMSMRKNKDKIAHIILDEPHQTPNAMKLLKDTIAEPRKFGLSYLLAAHHLGQLPDVLKEEAFGAGCQFMLLKGVSKTVFNEIGHLIGEDFEFEDIGNMEYEYGSLNVFAIRGKSYSFLTELPPALRNSKGELYIR